MQGRQSYNEKICGKILRFSRIWYSHKGRFIDRYDPRLFLHCQRSGLFYLFLIRFKETCNRCLYQKRSCHSNYAISLKRRDRTKHRTSYIHCKHKARRHTSFRVARRSKTHLRRHNRIGRLSFFSKINCKPRAVAKRILFGEIWKRSAGCRKHVRRKPACSSRGFGQPQVPQGTDISPNRD